MALTYETRKYPNDGAGIRQKDVVSAQLGEAGWRIVGEQIQHGHIKGGEACCLASLCLPMGLLAGRTTGHILVTYARDSSPQVISTTSAQHCPHCSTALPSDAIFCSCCGLKLQFSTDADTVADVQKEPSQIDGDEAAPTTPRSNDDNVNGEFLKTVSSPDRGEKSPVLVITKVLIILGVILLLGLGIQTLWEPSRKDLPGGIQRSFGQVETSPPGSSARTGAQVSESRTKISRQEIDVTKLGIQPKSKIIDTFGSPASSTSDGMDYYPWGFIAYKGGKLNQIDYAFKTKASSVREALEKVGLNQTSEPHKGPLSFYWNESTGPLVCCGFEMDNVVIPSDFSGISVGFRRIVAAAPPKPAAAKPRSRSPEKADEFLGARIALAKLLQAIYSKEGRLIDVSVTGEGQYILELSSVLMGKGTYTLEAARRETIDSSSSMAVIRRARFKRIVIRGNNYSETYAVN